MKKLAPLTVMLLASSLPAKAVTQFDHSAWDAVLKARVNVLGEVDYTALAADRAQLDAYLAQIAARSPDSHPAAFPSRGDELAYWLNAYNALTVQGVLDSYPLGSVREAGMLFGFFRKKVYRAGGETLSLNQIEHGIIRERYADPRVHFALVCASVSCPRLDRDAFRGGALDAHLERLTRRFASEQRNVRVVDGGKALVLSKIFAWYTGDFEKATGENGALALQAFLAPYLAAVQRGRLDAAAKRKITYQDYDWSLNSPGSRLRSKNLDERLLATQAGQALPLAGS